MTLDAGTLNRRVLIQRRVETPTGTGGSTTAWTDVARVWASVRMMTGLGTVRSDFPVSVARGSVRIRWREDVDATCRVRYVSNGKTTIFDVKSVLPDLVNREYVDLSVETGLNDG
jgi:SPP1 family predicted phage head-tail adaptor